MNLTLAAAAAQHAVLQVLRTEGLQGSLRSSGDGAEQTLVKHLRGGGGRPGETLTGWSPLS